MLELKTNTSISITKLRDCISEIKMRRTDAYDIEALIAKGHNLSQRVTDLKNKIGEDLPNAMDMTSQYAALRFKLYGAFTEARALTIRLCGRRVVTSQAFPNSKESSPEEVRQKEDFLIDKYLFERRKK
jgi:hypothetical protein